MNSEQRVPQQAYVLFLLHVECGWVVAVSLTMHIKGLRHRQVSARQKIRSDELVWHCASPIGHTLLLTVLRNASQVSMHVIRLHFDSKDDEKEECKTIVIVYSSRVRVTHLCVKYEIMAIITQYPPDLLSAPFAVKY